MYFCSSQVRYFLIYFNYIFRDQKWLFARSDITLLFRFLIWPAKLIMAARHLNWNLKPEPLIIPFTFISTYQEDLPKLSHYWITDLSANGRFSKSVILEHIHYRQPTNFYCFQTRPRLHEATISKEETMRTTRNPTKVLISSVLFLIQWLQLVTGASVGSSNVVRMKIWCWRGTFFQGTRVDLVCSPYPPRLYCHFDASSAHRQEWRKLLPLEGSNL